MVDQTTRLLSKLTNKTLATRMKYIFLLRSYMCLWLVRFSYGSRTGGHLKKCHFTRVFDKFVRVLVRVRTVLVRVAFSSKCAQIWIYFVHSSCSDNILSLHIAHTHCYVIYVLARIKHRMPTAAKSSCKPNNRTNMDNASQSAFSVASADSDSQV